MQLLKNIVQVFNQLRWFSEECTSDFMLTRIDTHTSTLTIMVHDDFYQDWWSGSFNFNVQKHGNYYKKVTMSFCGLSDEIEEFNSENFRRFINDLNCKTSQCEWVY